MPTYPTLNEALREAESIKSQIVTKFKPRKIILFGSLAKGNFGPDSDLDMLVVGEDQRRPLEVEQSLHRLINYRLATDFIFLNNEDFNQRLAENDLFLTDIVKTGKQLYTNE